MYIVGYAGQIFDRVYHCGGCGRDHRRRFAGNDMTVLQLYRHAVQTARLLRFFYRIMYDVSVRLLRVELLHERFAAVNDALIAESVLVVAGGFVITPDDLLLRRLAASLVVADTEADHVDAHIRGGFVYILRAAGDP